MLNYEEEIKKARSDNVLLLRENLMDENYLFKMRSYAERFNLPFEYVKLKVINDPIFALNFIKDPAKQSFHEKTAASYLSTHEKVLNFKNLSSGGKDALTVLTGIVQPYSTLKGQTSKKLKTVDFTFDLESDGLYHCFASHKYTKGLGGAQDNQYHDLVSFMENARQNTVLNHLFFAIADGEYYQYKNDKGQTKIDLMNAEYGNARTFALDINQLYLMLKHF